MPLKLLLLAQIYAPNRLSAGALPQTHLGSLHRSPRALSWFRGGAPGNGKEGGEGKKREGREGGEGTEREGRASRNAQMQSWQAYISLTADVLICLANLDCPTGSVKCGGDLPVRGCITSLWLCDGVNHCGNNWDENSEICGWLYIIDMPDSSSSFGACR